MAAAVTVGSSPASAASIAVCKRLHPGFTLDVNFSAPPGITMLFGASGAGKTTVLDCAAGLLQPDSGRIAVNGRLLFDSSTGVNVAVDQRSVGYVFQTLALFPHLSVESNVAYGLARLDPGERRRRVEAVLESFRIAALRDRRPEQISGGERQRVALARALVTAPCLLLLDEPLSGLDAATKSRILDDLRAWNQSHGIPILYVTHSREELFALGERVVALEQGKVLAVGTPREVLEAPRRESLAQLAGFENIFDAVMVAAHQDQGTMTCRIGDSAVQLEAPLGRVQPGERLRLAIRAGDILLATAAPHSLSARNVLPGKIVLLQRRDVMVIAQVDCGITMEVHLTPGAQHSLDLQVGRPVWLVLKTYSCHPLLPSSLSSEP